ncbi:MAG: neutral/alkaline non-lysosomal ceramidase N-terminal domain-containing protein [Treponema sp.]|jgi:hypothetical protein|nr:neutral/alkaline non-lysosomal ceramidase N-terminal domain-containing protein [Treponema sp.]
MKLGFARKDITPDFPVPLAGYMKDRISQGVHDKLYARALFFDDAERGPVVLLQLDLLCLDRLCLEKIYKGLQGGVPDKSRILVCSTHTHSGFGGIFDMEQGINQELLPLLGQSNPALIDLVSERSIEVISEAAKNCVETTVRINRGSIDGLGTNRRRKEIPCDNSLFMMEFQRADGKRILLYNLCCHPTVLNGDNRLLSADFPGAVAEKLEGTPETYDLVIFINGSAGDMSTRFTRRESSFAECSRYAGIIIKAIENTRKGEFIPLEKAELRYHSLSLRRTEKPDLHQARENLHMAMENMKELKNKNADPAAIRKAVSLIEGAQMNLLKAGQEKSDKTTENIIVETGILIINETFIVCSPLELFSSLAMLLKKEKTLECFGYINCLSGYLADCDAWDNLDYEALSGDFARGEGERYIELVRALV